jgi:fermentation-respiration switch protein FrsA (DUF1100 family)
VWQRGTGTSPAPRFDAGWTSIPLLPFIRQPTLIVAGTDDPIIPLANAKLMSRLLPTATVHIHDGGHVDLVVNAAEHARVIEAFLRSEPCWAEPHRDCRPKTRITGKFVVARHRPKTHWPIPSAVN